MHGMRNHSVYYWACSYQNCLQGRRKDSPVPLIRCFGPGLGNNFVAKINQVPFIHFVHFYIIHFYIIQYIPSQLFPFPPSSLEPSTPSSSVGVSFPSPA